VAPRDLAMSSAPVRIQLSRKKGWKMPPNTVKVDRTTKWGNPFIVGRDGSAARCLHDFCMLIGGLKCLSVTGRCWERMEAFYKAIIAEKEGGYQVLRGKNLACWCKPGDPCHADALLLIANRPEGHDRRFDVDAFMANYGLHHNGDRWVKGKQR
jgi:hypothetical protein